MQTIRRETLDQGVCLLTFDRPNSSANIFDRATLEELALHLEVIGSIDTRIRGLILTSAKDSIFIAGADLHGVRQMNPQDLRSFIELGQEVFSKLAALSVNGMLGNILKVEGATGTPCTRTVPCAELLTANVKSTAVPTPNSVETSAAKLPARCVA